MSSNNDDTWSSFHDDMVRPVPRTVPEPKSKAAIRVAGIEWDGSSGELRTGALEQAPATWDDLLRQWDLDPAEVEIVGPVRRSSWEVGNAQGQVTALNAYRARIQKRGISNGIDFEQMLERVTKQKPFKKTPPTGDMAFVACYGDLQLGKAGSEATVDRFLASLFSVPDRLKELRRSGRPIGPIFSPWLGDCLEHVIGSYASQQTTTELSLTEQLRLLKRLAWKQVEVLAPLTSELVIPIVPGNHDQAVRAGKDQLAHPSDSFAYDMAAYLFDLAQANPDRYGHVRIVVPERKSLVVTANMGGVVVAMAHGHQFPSSVDGYAKWWAGQAHGMQIAGEARILLAGHKHHWFSRSEGPKSYIQIPALDSGSEYYVNSTGSESQSGIVTFVATDSHPMGWDDLKIL